MPSKSEIAKRRLLRQEIDKHARADAEAKMPLSKQQLAALFDHLDHALSQGCYHSLRHTQAFLRSQVLPESTIITWVGEYGGYCDCEVLANIEEHWS